MVMFTGYMHVLIFHFDFIFDFRVFLKHIQQPRRRYIIFEWFSKNEMYLAFIQINVLFYLLRHPRFIILIIILWFIRNKTLNSAQRRNRNT